LKLPAPRAGLLGFGWLSHEPPPAQIGERVCFIQRRQPGDSLAATRDDDLRAPLDTLEMLAEPIVKLTHADLIPLAM